PGSTIFPLAEAVNEHRAFFPYIGLTLAVVWAIAMGLRSVSERVPAVRSALAPLAVVLAVFAIGGHAAATYERNKVWKTEETLWRDVVEKSPTNGRGVMNYGLTKMEQGKYAEANALFERALVYNPNYVALEINLGIVNEGLRQYDVAEGHFKRALD